LAIINNFSKRIKYYRDEIIKSYDYNYFLCKFISHLPLNIFTEFIKLLNIKNLNDFNNNKKTLKKLLKLRIKEYYNKFKISRNYGLGSKEIDIIFFFMKY
jgi:galactose-1-phosphate uridylyltransferase